MIRVQDEEEAEGTGDGGIHLVGFAGSCEHHVQKVVFVTQVVSGIQQGLADGVLVGPSGNRRKLGNQANRGFLDAPFRFLFLIEGGKSTDDRGGDRHGMGILG